MSNGVDFSNSKTLSRPFRDLKARIKSQHSAEIHLKADSVSLEKERMEKKLEKVNKSAGENVGRVAYANIYRARSYTDFTDDLMILSKSGAYIGDINHSFRIVEGKAFKYLIGKCYNPCSRIPPCLF